MENLKAYEQSCGRGTIESLFFPTLQHCLIQDIGSLVVGEQISLSLITKPTYNKMSGVTPMNRA
jgi:hypothetical protein